MNNVIIWEPIKRRVLELIEEGNQSSVQGWAMSEIVETITKEFDAQAGRKAREFIIVDVCNKSPDLVWYKYNRRIKNVLSKQTRRIWQPYLYGKS